MAIDLLSASLSAILYGSLAATAGALLLFATGIGPIEMVIATALMSPLLTTLGWILLGIPAALSLRATGRHYPDALVVTGTSVGIGIACWWFLSVGSDVPLLYPLASFLASSFAAVGAAAVVRRSGRENPKP